MANESQTLRTQQAARVERALQSIADTKRQVDTYLNALQDSSVELLETARKRVVPFQQILADAPPGLTPEINRNVNNALIFAKSAITTVLQSGYQSKLGDAGKALSATVNAWAEQPGVEFRTVTKTVGGAAKTVLSGAGDIVGTNGLLGGVGELGSNLVGGAGDAISGIIGKLFKSLWWVVVLLALIVVGVYFAKKKGLVP
jgi:hypothetical protein